MNQRFNILAMSTLLVMTMATTAFAQATFTASSGIEPRGRMNGHAERAGGITLFLNAGEITSGESGTVVIAYDADVTNDVDTAEGAITADICDTRIWHWRYCGGG